MLPIARTLAHTVIVLALFGTGVYSVGPGAGTAAAQGPAAGRPTAGAWCGISDTGGAVRMSVSPDSRFVESITIGTDRGAISSLEGTVVVPRAQIADEKFIFLGRDAQRDRCEPERCLGPNCLPGAGRGNVCPRNPTTGVMIRGTFRAVDHVRGNFTGVIETEIRSGNARGNVGARTVSRRVVGNYVAWPVGSAPCP